MQHMEANLTRDSVSQPCRRGFSESDARAIVELGPEAGIFAIMTLAKRLAELGGVIGKADPASPCGNCGE